MRSLKTKQPMPALTWIFAGSRVMEDGNYAADVTGYLVSIVNFDLTVIDVPALASNANEALEWETNLGEMPAAGARVTMVIEPAGEAVGPQALAAPGPIDVPVIKVGRGEISVDDRPVSVAELDGALTTLRGERRTQVRLAAAPDAPPLLVDTVRRVVAKHGLEVVEAQASVPPGAAQTQYDVIAELRREQQRLIDEADRIQRVIDELERAYQEMTTPRPAGERRTQP